MLERVYIDNYRTLVNCEIRLDTVSLLLGPNGGGKSAVFDAVRTVKRFVGGVGLVTDLFPGADVTRWQNLDTQTFELDVRTEQGLCRYTLKLKHTADRRRCKVFLETLTLDGKPLFTFEEGEVQLYNDRHAPGPKMSFDWNRSGLSAIYERHDNTKLTGFKERLSRIVLLRPCPPLMVTDSQTEAEELTIPGDNFPSWYRFLARQDISQQVDLLQELREAVDGLEKIRLEGPADSTVTLRVSIKGPMGGPPVAYKFGELSDGQRQLIVLYALLFGVSDERRVLFLDEPDNYLSPQEVEPWLTAAMDAAGRSVAQVIVISHHPEVIDHLAQEKGIWLRREAGGPTRVETGRARDTAPLRPSEVEKRGW